MNATVYAGDLSADLGFGRNMPPRFWRWCEKHNLRPIEGKPYAFDIDQVQDVISKSKGPK